MRRGNAWFYLGGAVVVAALMQGACGSAGPTSPSTSGGGGGVASVTISIDGQNGSQSFTPASVSMAVGQTVVWKNNDTVAHHVVQDTGAFDTGVLNPGETSAPITIKTTAGLPYHCALHPSMVGGVNTDVAPGGGPSYGVTVR